MGARSHHHDQQVILKRCEWKKKWILPNESGMWHICFRQCCGHSDFLKRERRQFIGFSAYWFLSILALLLLFAWFCFSFISSNCSHWFVNQMNPRPSHITHSIWQFFFISIESRKYNPIFFSSLFFCTTKINKIFSRTLPIDLGHTMTRKTKNDCIADWASGQTIGFNTIEHTNYVLIKQSSSKQVNDEQKIHVVKKKKQQKSLRENAIGTHGNVPLIRSR